MIEPIMTLSFFPHGVLVSKNVPISAMTDALQILQGSGYKRMSLRIASRLEGSIAVTRTMKDEEAWAKEIFYTGQCETPQHWIDCPDTGISSTTLLKGLLKLSGNTKIYDFKSRSEDVPHDADDFGRCYRLVNKHLPYLKPHLKSFSDPKWVNIIANWESLEALYASKDFAELSKRVAELKAVTA